MKERIADIQAIVQRGGIDQPDVGIEALEDCDLYTREPIHTSNYTDEPQQVRGRENSITEHVPSSVTTHCNNGYTVLSNDDISGLDDPMLLNHPNPGLRDIKSMLRPIYIIAAAVGIICFRSSSR